MPVTPRMIGYRPAPYVGAIPPAALAAAGPALKEAAAPIMQEAMGSIKKRSPRNPGKDQTRDRRNHGPMW